MKPKKLKLFTAFLLLLPLCVVLLGAGCEKNEEYSNLVEGYVVGSFVCYEVDSNGQVTGNNTEKGYCILLEGSKNAGSHWPMDFYTFDIPPGLFEFHEEISSLPLHGSDCGPIFFPNNFRNSYKIKFQYKQLKGTEKNKFECGPCLAMYASFPWENFSQVSLRDISIIN
jgi:hypothetical protein